LVSGHSLIIRLFKFLGLPVPIQIAFFVALAGALASLAFYYDIRRFFYRQRMKDPVNLEQEFRRSLTQNPYNPENLYRFGNFLNNRERYEEAEGCYKKAVELAPNNVTYLSQYAELMVDLEQNDKSEDLYKKCAELEPTNALHLARYGNFLWRIRQNFDLANQYFVKAVELEARKPKVNAHVFYAYANMLFQAKRDTEKADELYKQAIKSDSTESHFFVTYGGFLAEVRKEIDRAEVLFKKAIKLAPKDVWVLRMYAKFLREQRSDETQAKIYEQKSSELEAQKDKKV